ncbi:MAG: tetratricopeptide repeat protein [Ottowia sp.]|nr:tetratricopeptide repeat protein [Ottowia sp.]
MTNPKVFLPRRPDVLLQQGFDLHQRGKLTDAKALYQQVLAIQPRHVQALYLLGTLALQLRDLAMAESLLERAAQFNRGHAATLINLAMTLSQLNKHVRALEMIDGALCADPGSIAARNARVGILIKGSASAEALQAIDQLMQDGHQSAELWVNRGVALVDLGHADQAEACFDRALVLAPQHRQAAHHKVQSHIAFKRYGQALELASRCAAEAPGDAQAHSDRGHVLLEMRLYADAAVAYERACALEESDGHLAGLATALCKAGRVHQASAVVEKGRLRNAEYPPLWVAAGQVLAAMGDHSGAILNFDHFLAQEGNDGRVQVLKAASLMVMQAYEEASEILGQCDATEGDFTLGNLLYAGQMVADWSRLNERLPILLTHTVAGSRTYSPFMLLALSDDGGVMKKAAERYARANHFSAAARPAPSRQAGDRVRIGYFSADFHSHATCMLLAEVLESHDHEQFEVFGFSFGPIERDAMTDRVARGFDQFLYVKDWSPEQIVAEARRCQLDIAIDLKGYTQNGRPALFARGCAPVQVSFLGYPGTLGAEFMDYIVADKTVIPPEYEQDFSEKVVWMPHSYQCNDSRRPVATVSLSRAELGLPEAAFVFASFNNTYKLLPVIFACWMRILLATPGSVLWLYQSHVSCVANLRASAVEAGVDPDRLVFASGLPPDQHLARLPLADLFLDTLPCNAHTTASDALWAGLPLLTCMGHAFQGRVAASLLRALSLNELVTNDLSAYEATAIRLAHAPEQLGALRGRLKKCRTSSPLFDGRRYARNLEKAYRAMSDRHMAGLPPASFSVIDDADESGAA